MGNCRIILRATGQLDIDYVRKRSTSIKSGGDVECAEFPNEGSDVCN